MAVRVPSFESWSKYDLIALCDRLLVEDDPDAVEECVAFLEAETVRMWHGRARAVIARRLKHRPLTPSQRERVARVVLGRLAQGRFSEGFRDQLRLVLRLDLEGACAAAREVPAAAPEYVHRYAVWLLRAGRKGTPDQALQQTAGACRLFPTCSSLAPATAELGRWAAEVLVDPKPFTRLTAPRIVSQFGLPTDLAAFYAENEGVGLESSPDRVVRLCRLDEARRIDWRDLHILGADECPAWERFAAYRVGVSSFFDEIVYVLDAPSCSAGPILAIGVDVAGPGGSGSAALETSLVLASSFAEWLRHLEACGWVEYGLVPGGLAELPAAQRRQHRHYYQALNPGISWGTAADGGA